MYATAVALVSIWGAHDEFHHVRLTAEKDNPTWVNFKWYIAIARGAGYSMNLNCAIVIFLACRKIITWIRNTPLHKVMPLDKSFPDAHIIVGWSIMIAAVIHMIFHFVWLFTYNLWDPFKLWSFSMTVLMGCLLTLVFAVMFVTALPWFRHKKSQWRIFYVIHLVGAFLFFVLLLLHGMKRNKPETWMWVLPALIVYAFDRGFRHFSTKTTSLFLDSANSKMKPGKVLELRIPKPFNYKAGQFAEISVPDLGTTEWHPFTIASAPHEKSMVFYIKAEGDWCTKLYNAFERREKDIDMKSLYVRVRGPFGAPAQHTGAYKHVVLVSGGIGATPFAAIAKELHHNSITNVPEHAKVLKQQGETATKFINKGLPSQLRVSVDYMYGYGTEEDTEKSVKLDEAKKRADSLKLDSFTSAVSDTWETSNLSVVESLVQLDVESNILIPKRIQRFLEYWHPRKRLLSFLQSSRVTLALLLSMVVRFALVCIVAIWRQAEFGWSGTVIHPTGYWAVLVDAILGIILASVMFIVLILEISFMKVKFFTRSGRVLDFCAFFPLAILSAVASIESYRNPTATGALTIAHFALLLPLQFLLLANRLYRSLGSRTLLASTTPDCGCRCAEKVPNADFVWVTKTTKDDEWLRNELRPLADGPSLRLTRFVTRQTQEEVDQQDDEKHISSEAGRPDWEKLLARIADRTRSGAEVGVFFCGPKPMGEALKKAIGQVEVKSSLRGSYLATLGDDEVKRDFAIDNYDDVDRLRKFGCFVRFVFREENF